MSYGTHRLEGAVQSLWIHAVRHICHRFGRKRQQLFLGYRLKNSVPCRCVVVAASAKSKLGWRLGGGAYSVVACLGHSTGYIPFETEHRGGRGAVRDELDEKPTSSGNAEQSARKKIISLFSIILPAHKTTSHADV